MQKHCSIVSSLLLIPAFQELYNLRNSFSSYIIQSNWHIDRWLVLHNIQGGIQYLFILFKEHEDCDLSLSSEVGNYPIDDQHLGWSKQVILCV